jgi:hypothetical protein
LRRTAWFLAGALPVLAIVLIFKIELAPANDLVAGLNGSALSEKLLDFGRYAEIARAFFITGISFTQGLFDVRVGMHLNPGAVNIILLAAYLLIAGIRTDARDRTGLIETIAVLCLTLAGYFFVYVVTPLDLGYHLATSLNRLFLQLWPGLIFLIFMIAGAPEGVALRSDGPIPPAEQSKANSPQRKKHKNQRETK